MGAGVGNKRDCGCLKLYDVLAIIFLVALVIGYLCVAPFNKDESLLQKQNVIHEDDEFREHNEGCNLFSGRWVYDNKSFPLYKEQECSFMEEDFACAMYGRKDLNYQHWRWQPHQCNLPRFNGTSLLERLRGKKVVYVGDSLNRNQWVSMLCLIESSLPPSSNKSVIHKGNWFILEANEYDAKIAFYWSPFLVESNNDHPFVHRLRDRIIKISSIEKHAKEWRAADVLIFDSFMWWLEPTMTLLWGSVGSPDAISMKVNITQRYRVYEMGLQTWSDWLQIHINQKKTKLFFTSLSPFHRMKPNCYDTSHEPIHDEAYWGPSTDRSMMQIAESTIEKLQKKGLNIQYLNITQMSDRRGDGHPSIYRKFFHPLTEEELREPRSYADCVHWCLPGVPDTWNHILYTYLTNDKQIIQ